jgi:hypothetical protein
VHFIEGGIMKCKIEAAAGEEDKIFWHLLTTIKPQDSTQQGILSNIYYLQGLIITLISSLLSLSTSHFRKD